MKKIFKKLIGYYKRCVQCRYTHMRTGRKALQAKNGKSVYWWLWTVWQEPLTVLGFILRTAWAGGCACSCLLENTSIQTWNKWPRSTRLVSRADRVLNPLSCLRSALASSLWSTPFGNLAPTAEDRKNCKSAPANKCLKRPRLMPGIKQPPKLILHPPTVTRLIKWGGWMWQSPKVLGLQPVMVRMNMAWVRTKMGDAGVIADLQHPILPKINVLTKLYFQVSFVPAWQFIAAQYKNCQSLNAKKAIAKHGGATNGWQCVIAAINQLSRPENAINKQVSVSKLASWPESPRWFTTSYLCNLHPVDLPLSSYINMWTTLWH